ncbi:hypothetical protein BABINDRAFT_160415 [Babjeviella inositovora NRRL Y-12698]|uniref:Uncharacterized protein n=1 Tax=Babjeviella inositovora NRRL Y-12698 TaxID=984486 RepID=A0A1E3QVA6_9ASCO|nr:uncharacterized protein BABINDRAFT_160415 [Babjeviella inositovora NRRL Y-12698]ODQ80992.1 hypothetical protein BABINDRAFT_160415 [Babjeviella inositovora NRRL Y-12698]
MDPESQSTCALPKVILSVSTPEILPLFLVVSQTLSGDKLKPWSGLRSYRNITIPW